MPTSEVIERFHITKQTLNRWEYKTQYGVPFPAPRFPSVGGSEKLYLRSDVEEWEAKFIPSNSEETAA